jgi:hypothetical protein
MTRDPKMKNIRWANETKTGICYDGDASIVYIESGDLYDAIARGEHGKIADPMILEEGPLLELTAEQASALRQKAYQAEADPLFFQLQRGIVTEKQWLDKIAEIKTRYRKPT